jgi:signal transduction histidine kinase
VDQVISEVEVAAAARGQTVARPENSVAGDLPPVLGDAERIHQVLFNLLANAVRFTPPDGTVSVTAALSGDRCEVTVTDTGQGIPPEHLPFVFERFYRADAARARERGGTGIGLAIVRSIVEAHGGTVRAESDAGKGSAFTFDLPLAGTSVAAGLPRAAAAAEPPREAGRTDAPSADTVGATRAGARTGGTE